MRFAVREDDLEGPEIAELLQLHLDYAAEHTAPEGIHALDLARQLSPDHGEIKSMHTALSHRGKGVGGHLLAHILDEARARGYRRISLETGLMAAFAPARAFYTRFGFKTCPPFGDYHEDHNSVCMTLDLLA